MNGYTSRKKQLCYFPVGYTASQVGSTLKGINLLNYEQNLSFKLSHNLQNFLLKVKVL